MKNLLLTAVALMTLSAASFAQSGTTGPLTWKLYYGTLTISGTGAMPNYTFPDYAPWSKYSSNITVVVIEKGVTSIGSSAFSDCGNLTSVTVPEGITSIGSSAFSNCTNLTSVTIPRSVTSIYGSAFDGCSILTDIIVENANENYSSLDGVLFDKAKTILIRCPEGKIGSYVISEGVTNIGERAFFCCRILTSVIIPASVTFIGGGAFQYCRNLNSVTIPGNVTSINIGDSAFRYCISLTAVNIPESVTSIGERAFSDCSSLTTVSIPRGVTFIGEHAFSGCNRLTTVIIPEGVAIGGQAFSQCSNLTAITVPEGVTFIGELAFEGCTSLTAVTIPRSVTFIGDGAFSGCNRLTSVYNLKPVPQNLSTSYGVFSGVNLSHTVLYVPSGSVEAYKAAKVWEEFGNIFPYVSNTIELPATGNGVNIYPNPVKESFRVSGITVPTQITVTALSGGTVLQQTVAVNEPVAVGHLPRGVYMVRVNWKTVKIIVI